MVRLKADRSAGVRNPLIPTPNPIMKKMTPTIISGPAGPIRLLLELLISGSLRWLGVYSELHKINFFSINSNILNIISTFT